MMRDVSYPQTEVLVKALGIEYPILCGAMYPCSNPELVASVSEAGGMGIVQPVSLIYVYGYNFREGLRYIRTLTKKPFGMNVVVEKNSKIYEERMKSWVKIALEEGCRFFITALGSPAWVIEMVKPQGSLVFHDVTESRWAEKAVKLGVDGLICVNDRAGGHAGRLSSRVLCEQLQKFNLPLICAGGIGDRDSYLQALEIGYAGVQMGTRFIATTECRSHADYKNAILTAKESDIVLTERVTGIPLSVIRTPNVDQIGLSLGPVARFLFKHRRTKHWIRFLYNLRSLRNMKRSSLHGLSTKDYYQAGKSVSGISKIESVPDIIRHFVT